ncbi:hypothetical protein BN1723_008115 [Verticillium longisporum]|uniref:Uncharacterized protein n=1 Tax=Verticillium longisporum TaxID=100787 RepID=A0A0G4NQ63_VERLO|nr:hypothetical protein BN1723_008115 [Verticillium longisporum]
MPHTQSDKVRRPSRSGNRIANFFSSPKNKEQSAQQALLAMQQGNMTPSAMALPTISLSTASAVALSKTS